MNLIKKILLSIAALVMLTGAGGVYYIQTTYAGIGLPWVSAIDLPELPELPPAQHVLAENQTGDIYFPTRSPYDLSELLHNYGAAVQHTGKGHLTLPEGASAENPVPAMIILHGSGGIDKDREPVYAEFFARNGIAALVIDYYTVRGSTKDSSYLMKTLSASETDVIVDAYSALKVLGTHPAIDASRIGVTGYSYGGMATRYTLDPRVKAIVAPEVPRFAAHVDVYGPCHQTLGSTDTTGAPYLAVFGDEDYSVDAEQCKTVHGNIANAGSPVETLIIPGAGHAWESSRPRDIYDFPYISNCTMSFDPTSGTPMINGKATTASSQGATRGERAFARASIMVDAPDCIKRGYIIGDDENADTKAKAKMLAFLRKHLLQTTN